MAGTGKREIGNAGMVWDTAGRLLRYCPQILRLNIIHLMYGPRRGSRGGETGEFSPPFF